jgi:hypothetical protein
VPSKLSGFTTQENMQNQEIWQINLFLNSELEMDLDLETFWLREERYYSSYLLSLISFQLRVFRYLLHIFFRLFFLSFVYFSFSFISSSIYFFSTSCNFLSPLYLL